MSVNVTEMVHFYHPFDHIFSAIDVCGKDDQSVCNELLIRQVTEPSTWDSLKPLVVESAFNFCRIICDVFIPMRVAVIKRASVHNRFRFMQQICTTCDQPSFDAPRLAAHCGDTRVPVSFLPGPSLEAVKCSWTCNCGYMSPSRVLCAYRGYVGDLDKLPASSTSDSDCETGILRCARPLPGNEEFSLQIPLRCFLKVCRTGDYAPDTAPQAVASGPPDPPEPDEARVAAMLVYLRDWQPPFTYTSPMCSAPTHPSADSVQSGECIDGVVVPAACVDDWWNVPHRPRPLGDPPTSTLQPGGAADDATLATSALRSIQWPRGTFRFMYLGLGARPGGHEGPPTGGGGGTYTRRHMDVLGSYSWSLNVTGTKAWRFYAAQTGSCNGPDGCGQVVDGCHRGGTDAAREPPRDSETADDCYWSVMQQAGDMIIVPPRVEHQVRNEAVPCADGTWHDTVASVNHNWTNAFGLPHMMATLSQQLYAARALSDRRSGDVSSRWLQPEAWAARWGGAQRERQAAPTGEDLATLASVVQRMFCDGCYQSCLGLLPASQTATSPCCDDGDTHGPRDNMCICRLRSLYSRVASPDDSPLAHCEDNRYTDFREEIDFLITGSSNWSIGTVIGWLGEAAMVHAHTAVTWYLHTRCRGGPYQPIGSHDMHAFPAYAFLSTHRVSEALGGIAGSHDLWTDLLTSFEKSYVTRLFLLVRHVRAFLGAMLGVARPESQ